ncbi:MAG TPA: aliphatic sulfonate ABC transporter substrate-binding protein [Acidocella sp.]|jgi:sulfonate transport system substrate-binding protein|uniref:aliphatic sulfonate ABC transporter substrate-binding protein n=1 Tax=Acidocella sp. TaxID=50710 RepID=UPI002BDB977A|nr:aliphatic sulfonate ABC transporter substrate-binding protein [Acidocella sp.]HVE22963.1 aliphatic sulfonate ABC transporter substrate-binding protein [Acidocella sp.]
MAKLPRLRRRQAFAAGASAGFVTLFSIGRARAAAPSSITIDYAYYSPLSLVLKNNNWVQEALGPGISVNWVLSQGSNKALEFLRGRSIVLGSAAGSATLLTRATGTPVQAVYVNDLSETTALVAKARSGIKTPADLKGKRVAATPGTEPYAFLLRALSDAQLTVNDISLVPLQHPLGRAALDRGDVDAWAGLDPFMAEAQLQNHDVLFYRNPGIITPNVLVARDDFVQAHPEIVFKLLQAYERARRFALENPQALVPVLAQAANLPVDVAQLQLTRQHFDISQINADGRARIAATGTLFQKLGLIPANVDVQTVVDQMADNQFTGRLANG